MKYISIFNIIDRIYINIYKWLDSIKNSEVYSLVYWMMFAKLSENDIKKIKEPSKARRKFMARRPIFNYVNLANFICMDAFEGVDDKFRARQKSFPLWGTGPTSTRIQELDYVCTGMASKRIGIFRIERIIYVNSVRWHGRASWVGYYTIHNLNKYINDEVW